MILSLTDTVCVCVCVCVSNFIYIHVCVSGKVTVGVLTPLSIEIQPYIHVYTCVLHNIIQYVCYRNNVIP